MRHRGVTRTRDIPPRKHVYMFSARATHDAQCFGIGFYLIGKVNGQVRVSEGTTCKAQQTPSSVHAMFGIGLHRRCGSATDTRQAGMDRSATMPLRA